MQRTRASARRPGLAVLMSKLAARTKHLLKIRHRFGTCALVSFFLLLYSFLIGVGMLETGIGMMGTSFNTEFVETVRNPLAGLFAGILLTIVVQSSSVSTSTIVGLVGSGSLTVKLAVPMIMGCNIGTTITNTLVSMGSARRSDEFRRAFAAATVHDFFNLIAVAVLFTTELITGFLRRAATGLTDVMVAAKLRGTDADSPLRVAVKAPIEGLQKILPRGVVGGLIMLVIGLVVVLFALMHITRNMKQLMSGRVERVMNTFLARGGGVCGIVAGMAITVAVQSSSITTSLTVPMVAGEVLTLSNAYLICIGANIGTTVTGLLASLAVEKPEGLTIALVHVLFNCSATLLIYPVPQVRNLPIKLAQLLADIAVSKKWVAIVYVIGTFVVIPLFGVFVLR